MSDEQQIIAKRYRIESKLGTGGMSTVYLAVDDRLERKVAIKLLAENLADDRTFVSRFHREALAAARMVHPNIVQVFDYGLDEKTKRHFIVMEYVAGKSCAKLLEEQGKLKPSEVIGIIVQACRGLEYAHRHGVIHRDVKPGNLIVSDDGVVKLADFGIAKATEQSSLTQADSVLGTAAYISPEQTRGEDAGPPSDLYSLGVVAYQLLTNRVPHQANSITELAMRQQQELPPDIEWVNPEVTTQLAAAVTRALVPDPANRYPTARAMEQGFNAAAQGMYPEEVLEFPEQRAEVPGLDTTPTTDDATRLLPQTAATAANMPGYSNGQIAVPHALTAQGNKDRRVSRRTIVLLTTLLVVVIVAAGVTLGIVSFTEHQRQRVANITPIASDNAQETIAQLQQLIDNNTR